VVASRLATERSRSWTLRTGCPLSTDIAHAHVEACAIKRIPSADGAEILSIDEINPAA
jgi:hypothetical protein